MQMRELEYKGYPIWCSKLGEAWYVSVRSKEDWQKILWSGQAVCRQASGIVGAKVAIDKMEEAATNGSA